MGLLQGRDRRCTFDNSFFRKKKQLSLDHKKGGSTTREKKNGSTASETQTVEGGSGMRPDWIILDYPTSADVNRLIQTQMI